ALGGTPATAAGRPLSVRSATPNTKLGNLFTAYANTGVGWTGADSTYSGKLPGGREIWIFSDTFLGPVNPDGGRPTTAPFINNSVIVRRGSKLSTVTGTVDGEPAAIFRPADASNWYWMGPNLVTGKLWQQVVNEYTKTGPGSWDLGYVRTAVAHVDTDRLDRPVAYHPLPSLPPTISWAAWLQRVGGYTYVYGVEDLGASKHMHVARVRGTDLRRPWRFWTGDGWSAEPADSTRVLTGVANEYSVTPWRGRYLLVTHDTNELFSARILGYVADAPTGPFTDPVMLYTTPETGPDGSYGNPNIITYNSHIHPEHSTDRRLLLTYNVNTLANDEHYQDASIYRPRFVDVELA
ncbi:DUF4185 domain-containing protein, partial [Asanoa siamensis]|uniref:DUF4185 domain-containing protein n=1 Tax=Asanoa siamensis TaxID=926357 RepID=UPI001943AEE9